MIFTRKLHTISICGDFPIEYFNRWTLVAGDDVIVAKKSKYLEKKWKHNSFYCGLVLLSIIWLLKGSAKVKVVANPGDNLSIHGELQYDENNPFIGRKFSADSANNELEKKSNT